jgi:glycosyltransferase involved in cell wall biosynthesis
MIRGLRVSIVAGQVGKTPIEVTQSFIFDEAYRLAMKGIEIHIVRSKIEKDSKSYGIYYHGLEKIYDAEAIWSFMKNIYHYPPMSLLRRPTSIYWENLYAINVSKIVEKYNINLIHAHFAYPEGWVGLLAKIKIRRPLLVTAHGYDLLTEPKVGYGVRLSRRYDQLVRKVFESADYIIVASRALYKEAINIVRDPEKIRLIPNGVDLERFNPSLDGSMIKKLYNAEDKYVIFTLRHHRPVYGIAYLILAAKKVLEQRKDVIFIIGGGGVLLDYHIKLAKKLGISDHIIFTGAISRNQVPYYYVASDIVVVPSLQEAWGLVATEAMASGKPVIATNVGGLPDQVIDDFNGYLVPPRDPKAIADKVLYLLENPSEIKKMGYNARRLAEEKFDIEKRIDNIIKLYRSLV